MRETAAHPSKGLRTDQPYEAIVVDENDPDKLGQIRARVPGLMDGIPDDQLPWARPRDWNHPFGQMAKKKTGIGKTSFFGGVPRRGNKVELFFPTGDAHVAREDAYARPMTDRMPAIAEPEPAARKTHASQMPLRIALTDHRVDNHAGVFAEPDRQVDAGCM